MKPTRTLKQRLGRCYELAYLAVTELHPDWTLVHGQVRYPGDASQVPYPIVDHGWCEHDIEVVGHKIALVFDPVFARAYPKDYYYKRFRATALATYTDCSARAMAVKYGTFGRWHDQPEPIQKRQASK